MSKDPKALAVDHYLKALGDHDLTALDRLYADDASLEDPFGSEPIRGKANILKFYQTAFSAGISARLEGEVRVVKNVAIFPFVYELNPGNGEMRVSAIKLMHFNSDGKIAATTSYWGPDNTSTP